MRAAAAEDVDWARFGRVLARHRIEGLAHEALVQAGARIEAGAAQDLRRKAGEIGLAALRMAAETSRLQAALDQAGLINLVLKGATLDILAWGRVGLKRAWDIDLVVEAADAGRARTVLGEAGYELIEPAGLDEAAFDRWASLSKECVLRRKTDDLVVELHWSLIDPATLLPGLSARSPCQLVQLSPGVTLRTLAAEELFAYLCVHGASHAWSRLKWLADLGAILAGADETRRTQLFRRARELGAGHTPAAAFLLCDRLLGLPLPAPLAAEIGGNRKARALAALALDALAGGGGETEIATRPMFAERILLSYFLFEDGWRYRWAEWRRQGISLDDHMRLRLPRGLAFLYPILRLPLWLWRRWRRRSAHRLAA